MAPTDWVCFELNGHCDFPSNVKSTIVEGVAVLYVRGTTDMIKVGTKLDINVCSKMSSQLRDLEVDFMPVKICRRLGTSSNS